MTLLNIRIISIPFPYNTDVLKNPGFNGLLNIISFMAIVIDSKRKITITLIHSGDISDDNNSDEIAL